MPAAASTTRTVLLVDDHHGFRTLANLLLGNDGFEVVGEAVDGESAINAVRRQRPDVVLLDVQLPGIDGFEVAGRLARLPEAPAVVMTSTRDAADIGARLVHAPIAGFVAKQELSAAAVAALLD